MADHVQEPGALPDPLAEPLATGAAARSLAGAVSGAHDRGLGRSGWSWALFEGVRNPYVILITIYIFAPYFATVLVGDPVRGQALVAKLTTIQGLFVAFTVPVLGAVVDRLGPRKPLLALLTAAMVVLTATLWWAKPDGSGLSLAATAWILGVIGVVFAYGEVLHNSLLVYAAPPSRTSDASGLGNAMGNGFAMIGLVFVLWAFALPGKIPLPGLPAAPLFGMANVPHGSDRIVAPLVAATFAIGAIPLFLFTRDAPKGLGGGVNAGLNQLWTTVKGLRRERDMGVFLVSRMLYTDGMSSILIFAGVLARGVMHWSVLDMLAYGVIISFVAVGGGLLAAKCDTWFGTKRAIQLQLITVIVCEILLLGVAPGRIIYMPYSGAPVWGGPVFKTVPELVFLGLSCVNALGVTGSYVSGRVMLTRLTVPEKTGSYFGLFGLSGSVTLWVGALLVSLATSAFGSQQAGFIPIAGLLIVGFVGLSLVDVRRAQAQLAAPPQP